MLRRFYEITDDDYHVFLKVPRTKNSYFKVHRCVVEAACPRCDAPVGEPCRSRRPCSGECHAARKSAAQLPCPVCGKRVAGTHSEYCQPCGEERRRLSGAATRQVKAAIRDGRLTIPDACEECGSTDSGRQGIRFDAHHDRYDQPLTVRWLCRRCHRQHHANEKRARRAA